MEGAAAQPELIRSSRCPYLLRTMRGAKPSPVLLLYEGDGAGRRRFGMQVNKIAEMEKTRDTAVALVSTRLGKINIVRIVRLKKRHHLSPAPQRVRSRRSREFTFGSKA